MNRLFFAAILTTVLFSGNASAFAQERAGDGWFYFERGQERLRKMEYENALREYRRAVQLEPGNPRFFKAVLDLCDRAGTREEKWRQSALFYRRSGQDRKALFFYRKLLLAGKGDAEIWSLAGDLHSRQRRLKAAWACYGRSLKAKENADAYRGRGDVHFFRGLFDSAVEEYEKALSLEPAHPAAHGRLGQIHERRGEYGKALSEHRRVLESKQNDAETWIRVGRIHETTGDFRSARSSYRKALESDPGSLKALNGLGRTGVALGEHEEAERYFRMALGRSAGSGKAEALNGLGWLFAWRGDERGAVRCFYQALGADELSLEARTGLGWVYSRQEDYDRAIRWYRKAKRDRGGALAAAAFAGMAWIYARQGEVDRAISLYKRVLSGSPQNVEAYNGLGWMHLQSGDPDSARRFYERSLLIREHNPDAYYGLARLAEQALDFEEAARNYRRAIGLNPLNLPYRKALALCYFKSGDHSGSLEILEMLASKGADDEEILSKLAFLNLRLGKTAEAKESHRRVLAADPGSPDALAGLGEALFLEGDDAGAVRAYRRALRADPNHRAARRGLARVYQKRGFYDRAIPEIRKLIAAKQNDVESWNNLGKIYRATRQDNKAIECYEQGLSFSEANPDGLLGLSEVYLGKALRSRSRAEKNGYFREARETARKALSEAPGYVDAYLCLARICWEEGNLGPAQEILGKGLQVQQETRGPQTDERPALKQELDIRTALFRIEPRQGPDAERLISLHEELLNLKVNDAEVWLGLASLHRWLRQYGQAQETLERALGFVAEEQAQEVRLCLAEAAVSNGDLARAEKIYNALLRSCPAQRPRIWLGLGKIAGRRGNPGRAVRCYKKALPDPEARLAFCLETGRLSEAERYYRGVLERRPGDFDSLAGMAHIARLRGDYPEAVGRYRDLLKRAPDNAALRRMLGNVHFWTGDWEEAKKEYGLALQEPETGKDLVRLKRAAAPSITPRFKVSESKEDDTGKGSYVIRTSAWDAGLLYRHPIAGRWALNGGFSYASTEERNLLVSQTNFDLDMDHETVGFEHRGAGGLEVSGAYHHTGYRAAGDPSGQRTPLKANREFHGYAAEMGYRSERNSAVFRISKEPFLVKIFGADPEVSVTSRYRFLLDLSRRLSDLLKVWAAQGWTLYSPAGTSKPLFRAGAALDFYDQEITVSGEKADLPLSGFQRPDGLRVLGVKSAGVSYANRRIERLTLTSGFKRGFYSDGNESDLFEAGALFDAPFLDGLNFGYRFRFEDYRFTAGAVGGEPLYRSPQDLSVHSFSIGYEGRVSDKLAVPFGYTFSVSSEDREGHSLFLRPSYEFSDGAKLNLELEMSDDAGFSKEKKFLVYFTKHFL